MVGLPSMVDDDLPTGARVSEQAIRVVTVLADTAELAREIDIDRAKRARQRAEERIRQTKKAELDYSRAEAALQRALARLRVAEKHI